MADKGHIHTRVVYARNAEELEQEINLSLNSGDMLLSIIENSRLITLLPSNLRTNSQVYVLVIRSVKKNE